ncbi:MAG: hypothetical protein KKB31_06220, partial [Nanoarchaeota archaeon]|nr:hypothetical protein [Nanoarchaeota archaeon]
MKKKKNNLKFLNIILLAVVVLELVFIFSFEQSRSDVTGFFSKVLDVGGEIRTIEKIIDLERNFELKKRIENRKEYDIINVPNSYDNFEIGEPSIPFEIVHVVIPFGFEMKDIEITNSLSEELPGVYNILPTPVPEDCCERDIDMESLGFVQEGPSVYDLLKTYPKKLVNVLDTGTMGSHNIVTLQIFHFQYNPGNTKLVFYDNVGFKINLKETTTSNPRSSNSAVDSAVKNMVINPEDVLESASVPGALETTSEFVNYLIITDSAHVSDFQRIADYKQSKGLSTEILTVEYIYSTYSGV